MTRSEPTLLEQAELQVRCGFCKAPTGAWCVTPKGGTAQWLHGARTDQVVAIFRLGVLEGQRTASERPA